MYGGVVRLNELSQSTSTVLSENIVIYRSVHLDISFLTAAFAEFRKLHPVVFQSYLDIWFKRFSGFCDCFEG